MDTVPVILEGLRVIVGFLMLFFVPGFALSLVIFPRFTDIGIIKRLAYSTVLSIGSVITTVLFMYVVLRMDTTPENIIIVVAAFSCFAFFGWLLELWYLNSRLKDHQEPQLLAGYQELQRYYSREINAAKDQFRQDTRTVVVYHESERLSGMNFVNHSYLMDVAEEIDIQQVAENKVKGTDSFFLESPYPKTRYFELIIREYNEGPFSQVDDLQIYPVLVTTKPETIFPGTTLQQDTLRITERIYQKTSTEEVQWIYSHDFHIFAFIHAEDTLDQMVDRILGKLDEIALSIKRGIYISSYAEDRQILRETFDEVIEKPCDTPVKPPGIAPQPEVQAAPSPKAIPKRPVILVPAEPKVIPKRPVILVPAEPKAIPQPPVILVPAEPKAIPQPPVIQVPAEPKVIPQPPVIQVPAEPKVIPQRPNAPIRGDPKEIDRRRLQKEILQDLNIYGITRNSFAKSRRNIENIKIPEKMDVNKRLADVEEEVQDLTWLYE